jgi:transposase, IS6 family
VSSFAGYRFPDDIIALAVRWYLSYRLPYADVAALLAERGVYVDASTVFDWVQRFTPLYQEFARPYRHRPRGKWSIDETYVKVAGVACYVFRAMDELGQVIDVYVSPRRDTEAATLFLTQAMARTDCRPHTATTDKAAIYPPALRDVLPEVLHITESRNNKPLNEIINTLRGDIGRCEDSSDYTRRRRSVPGTVLYEICGKGSIVLAWSWVIHGSHAHRVRCWRGLN